MEFSVCVRGDPRGLGLMRLHSREELASTDWKWSRRTASRPSYELELDLGRRTQLAADDAFVIAFYRGAIGGRRCRTRPCLGSRGGVIGLRLFDQPRQLRFNRFK